MPGIPNASVPVHLLPVQCQGKRNEKEREDGLKCSRKPSIQRWVGLYLDGTVSPSVSPANDNTLEMFWIPVTCTHITYIYKPSSHWPDVGRTKRQSTDTVPSFIRHQDHPSSPRYTLKTSGHMAWESSSSRCQVAIFYNTQTQWLDSSLIIKKGLCAFNNPGKGRIKQIFQELQHQRRVGGAGSAHVWLARCWDDTVTAIFICKRKLAPSETDTRLLQDSGATCWKVPASSSSFFFFLEEYHTSVPHIHLTGSRVRTGAVLSRKKKKLMWLTDLIVEVNGWALWRRICAA